MESRRRDKRAKIAWAALSVTTLTGTAGQSRGEVDPPRALSIPVLVAIAAVLVGGVLRFATLGSQSLWFDEAQLAHEARLSLGGLLNTIGVQETSPPLYFVLAWLWAKLFGAGDVALRSLSALLGTGSIALAYLSGRALVSRRAGAVAAVLVALSPFMIWYSQEAREYMLLVATSAASLLFFTTAWHRGEPRQLALWAVFSALALLTHFFAGFLVGPEVLLLLWRWRQRKTWLAAGVVLGVQLALLPLALGDAGHPLGWLSAIPLSTRLQQVPVAFAANTLDRTSALGLGLPLAGVLLAVVIVLLLGGASARELHGAALAGGLALCGLLIPLTAALVGHDFFIDRALIGAWIPLSVVLAAACTTERWRLAGLALAAAVTVGFLLAGIAIDGDPSLQRPDWRGVAQALGRAPVRRAVVAYDGSLATDPLALYLPGVAWRQDAGPVSVGEVDVVSGAFPQPVSLPAGVTLRTRRVIEGLVVRRFSLTVPWRLSAAQISARTGALLSPAPVDAAVLIQPRTP